MRRVIESTLVSADGVIGDPHTWTGEHFGEQAVAYALERLRGCDAMVMGRRTYEMFSKIWATPANDYAAAIYEMRKYVFSSTLPQADWNNTQIMRSNVADTIGELKQQDGRDIVLYGHGPVGQALLESDLLDELNLWVHPGHRWQRDAALSRGPSDLMAVHSWTGGCVRSLTPRCSLPATLPNVRH
jgi:dihydrofolate reductase